MMCDGNQVGCTLKIQNEVFLLLFNVQKHKQHTIGSDGVRSFVVLNEFSLEIVSKFLKT